MLKEIYPRGHARLSPLRLLGPHVEGFVSWLHTQGYPPRQIRLRLRQLPQLEKMLRRRRIARLEDVTAARLLGLAPKGDSENSTYLGAAIRSLVRYFGEEDQLATDTPTQSEKLIAAYMHHLAHVRGLAASTLANHRTMAAELLTFIGLEPDNTRLQAIGARDIEGFLRLAGSRRSRAGLKEIAGQLRSFLRFLAGRGLVASGLDAYVETPRLYRGERLPRSLPWNLVQGLLATIDRSTPTGRRNFAMLLLVATYGLRVSEVTALRLDDIHWRAGRLHVSSSKTGRPLFLPLTDEVGAAIIDYLRHGRPQTSHREIFLRVHAPIGTLRPGAVSDVFDSAVRRSGLPIPIQGAHCLRHSLAVRLLRQGTPVKALSDLLGHRSIQSTCTYLRLHVEDLRDVALDLPQMTEAQS